MTAKNPKGEAAQVRAFRKAARELGAGESEADFDAALKTVARHKPVADPVPKDEKRNIQDE
jgi:hypothetical protein